MARKRKTYNLKSRITSALRRIWFYGPQRREAVKIAKERGNTCAICNAKKEKLQIDHINSVAGLTGEYTWDEYINRMFCDPDGLRAICETCHHAHTTIQSEIRKNNKTKQKSLTKKTKSVKIKR